jgi:hypothetical protein
VTALTAAVHALAVPLLYDGLAESALDLRAASAWLRAEGIDDGPAAKQLGERHQAWRTQNSAMSPRRREAARERPSHLTSGSSSAVPKSGIDGLPAHEHASPEQQ